MSGYPHHRTAVIVKEGHGHCGTCGGFDGVRARARFRRLKTTPVSVINETTPIVPQAHFISGPAVGSNCHTTLVTKSKAKVNTVTRGGATFGLVMEKDYKPEATPQSRPRTRATSR
jgi:hypothetical protein